MFLPVSYDSDFDDLWMHLKSKYPDKLFELDGVGKQLDMVEFTNKFFSEETTTTADVSVDANANVTDVNSITYDVELPKSFMRLNSYYYLWKELKRLYDRVTADEIIEQQISGDIYINDVYGIASSKPYCFNYSTYDIMQKGLPMITKIKSIPPKYLYSFKSQVEQFVIFAANSTLGATGLADLLLVMSYYVKNILKSKTDAHFSFGTEESCWKYVEENIKSFIYTINQPLRGGIQSSFTNLSIYDDYFLKDLQSSYIFDDGETFDIDIVKKLQEIFLKCINEELSRTPLTFPVLTACFSTDENHEIKDEKFAKFIAHYNKEYGQINIYCGSSSTLSSCCFSGDTKVLTKSSNGGVNLCTFKELKNSDYKTFKNNFTIFHNGSWVKGKEVELSKKQMYKIVTTNNKEIIVTEDHIHPTLNGDKSTNQLTNEDYLLFNTNVLDTYPEIDDHMTFEEGFLIGMYLGDGSTSKKSNFLTLSLNQEKYNESINKLNQSLNQLNISKEFKLGKIYHNVYPVSISSEELKDFIKTWVYGEYSYEKRLNLNCLLQSKEFRQGIIEGYYLTDGGNSNRIYSSSKELIEDIEVLLTSLGMVSIIDVEDRTNEIGIIRGEEFNHNFPIYCIRWYSPANKRSMGDVYKIKNNSIYFRIKSINKIDYNDNNVYCFEMQNEEEPYFTLPNGIITHNCRLRSDRNNEYFNSFGAGSTKIGSLGVCTINLPRLAYKNKGNKDKFLEDLKDMVKVCSQVNNAKRRIMEKRMNYLPLYTLGFMELSKQYSTCGINGFNEAIEILGENILTENGTNLGLQIIDTINNENDKYSKQYNTPHNCEQIPAENVAVKLAAKDKLMKYNKEYELYSNQFIPLTTNADLLDRITLQGKFDNRFTGGAILHCNCETKIEDENKIVDLIKYCAKQGVIYWAINYNLQECENGHMTVGLKDICSICGKPIVNNYTRVVGFLTNSKNWNPTRRKEDYPNRKWYKEI